MERQTFSANEILFNEGDDGDGAYLVESGSIEISVHKGEDKKVLGIVEAGSLFGEMALISNLPRMATATATSHATCVVIHQNVMRNLIAKSDPLMSALLLNLIGHVRSLNEKLNPQMVREKNFETFFRGEDGAYKRHKND